MTDRLPRNALQLEQRMDVYLDACIARDFPGLGRDMQDLRTRVADRRPRWPEGVARLARPEATPEDRLTLLADMYGAANYAVLDDVAKLPLQVLDIYRKLTT